MCGSASTAGVSGGVIKFCIAEELRGSIAGRSPGERWLGGGSKANSSWSCWAAAALSEVSSASCEVSGGSANVTAAGLDDT